MPQTSVTLTAGANVELTPTLNQAAYLRTQNSRFRSGVFEKLGGWSKYVSASFSGIIRSLWAWQDLNAQRRLSVAATQGVTVITGINFTDLTPQQLLSDFPEDFSTTSGSSEVEVVDPNLTGVTDDMVVEFRTPISVGGLILSGTYPIILVTGADSYIIDAGVDATATVANGGVVPEFTTLSGSPNINVDLPAHAQTVGNTVVFPIPTVVGGLTVLGRYSVTSVVDADNFVITADAIASASTTVTMNGGEAQINYHIAVGPIPSGFGYGLGDYGEGAYGLGSSSGQQTGTPITATDWVQDNWGEILITCPEGGGIYYWQPGTGFQNLSIIPDGPLYNDGVFMSQSAQQLIAWGSTVDAREAGGIGVYQDPLLVKYSDVGNFLQWAQLPENFAREERLSIGSKCVAGCASKNRNLVWTDLALYAGTFSGTDSVYTWNQVGSNCGVVGKHAWAQQADTVYWMGLGNFFAYSGGGVVVIPCTVWDRVFQTIHPDYRHRTVAGSNSDFTEIWWWFASLDSSGEVDSVVKYNVLEQTWDFNGPIRTAWLDRSLLGNPLGSGLNSIVYKHEFGWDDDTNPLLPEFQTGDFYLDEGRQFTLVKEVTPDFIWSEFGGSEQAQIQITLLARNEPGDAYREYGPYTVSKASPAFVPTDPVTKTWPRCKQLAMRVGSIDVGSFWRLGKIRFLYQPDGMR